MITPQHQPTPVPAAQLLVMPLHAITEIHGETGLRRRLTPELDQLPALDRRMAETPPPGPRSYTPGSAAPASPTSITCCGSRCGSCATTASPTPTS